jgi:TolA-binding protein
MLKTLYAAGVAVAILLPAAARAQMITSREGIALENQILELKHQIQTMQQGGGNGGSVLGAPAPERSGQAPSSDLVASLLDRVHTLNGEVQDLRGRVDTLEHEVATQHDEIKQEIGNLKFQLDQGGKPGFQAPANAPQGAPPLPSAGKPHTLGTLPRESSRHAPEKAAPAHAEASLGAARAALSHHDYKAAEADAHAVIAKQGKRAGKGEASLILAQSLFHQGRHQEAAIAFDDAYNADRAGPHAPDALLGLANSLTAIHQNQEACDTLDSLTSQFSSPSPALKTRIEAARRRAACH